MGELVYTYFCHWQLYIIHRKISRWLLDFHAYTDFHTHNSKHYLLYTRARECAVSERDDVAIYPASSWDNLVLMRARVSVFCRSILFPREVASPHIHRDTYTQHTHMQIYIHIYIHFVTYIYVHMYIYIDIYVHTILYTFRDIRSGS